MSLKMAFEKITLTISLFLKKKLRIPLKPEFFRKESLKRGSAPTTHSHLGLGAIRHNCGSAGARLFCKTAKAMETETKQMFCT